MCKEDPYKILKMGTWFLGRKRLVLQLWYKGFRLKMENINLILAWVSLPNLSLEYKNVRIITGIGNIDISKDIRK